MAKVIGVTGGFGTGKTFVASIFKSLGAKVIDADRIAHEAIRRGSPEYRALIKMFGSDILSDRREIDRRKLGEIVFRDAGALRKLNAIVHPAVIKEVRRRIRGAGEGVVVIDAPLLVEAHLEKEVDELVVVKCSKRRQIERCREKFRIKKKEIMRRIRSQIPLKRKMEMADLVIDNSLTKAETRRQARKVWGGILWR